MPLNLNDLLAKLSPGAERCGVIKGGEIVECENLHPSPLLNFALAAEELEGAEATWHTHPISSANLSQADFEAFLQHPSLLHYIVSDQNVWCYSVQNGMVIFNHEKSHITRLPR